MPDQTITAPPPAPPELPAGPAPLPLLVAADEYDGPTTVDEMKAYATWIAESDGGMLPELYVGKPANIGVAMMHAQRLRIPVMTAIHELWYDGGQVAMKASLIQRLVRRAGHDLIIGPTDKLRCVVEIRRGDGRTGGRVEWTIGEAIEAGLVANQTWQDYPADCLFARAVARAARRYAADATGGVVYVVEEILSGYAEGGEADAVLVDRTVTPMVAELLAGIEGAKHNEVRKRWQTAVDGRLLNSYAADGPDGAPWTLGMVLRRALEATMPAPRTAPPISGGPAGAAAGLAACGRCQVDDVVMNGDHGPGCPEHIGDPLAGLLPAAPIAPAPGPSERVKRDRPAPRSSRSKKKKRNSRKGGRRGGRR
jgi:hypothetical protein